MTLMRTTSIVTAIALTTCGLGTAQTGVSAAVLPFENAGSYGRDKEEFDALRRGLAATLATELSAAGAQVIGRARIQAAIEAESVSTEKIDLATAARIGKGLGARFVIVASFIDLYGDFRIDANIVDVESGQVVKVVRSDPKLSDQQQMYRSVQSVADRLGDAMQLRPRGAVRRNVPSEALGLFSRGLLFGDRGDRQRATEFLNRALKVFPDYPEALAELKRLQGS